MNNVLIEKQRVKGLLIDFKSVFKDNMKLTFPNEVKISIEYEIDTLKGIRLEFFNNILNRK